MKKVIPVKGYFVRAKVFALMMLFSLVLYLMINILR
jgi:hypothetical protein